MNKKSRYTKITSLFLALSSVLYMMTSCLDDLDQENPRNENTTEIYNEEVCKAFLAKIYSGLATTGNDGVDGKENDLTAPDGDQGSLGFLRGLITMQEFPTDEAIWNWKDEGIVEIVSMNWDYTTKYAYTFYQRTMLNIRFSKEFLDQYTTDLDIPNIEQYRDEVRALRALNYYYLIDMYGNPGVVWDDSPTSDKSWYPSQIGRTALFELIVNELEDLAKNSTLPETASMATYGKMTKPVIWTLLAKMYLNAEVYTGTPQYDKAREYCEKVMSAGFGLENNYSNLFCGENHLSPLHGNEIIYAIPFDATNIKSYGGTIMVTTGAFGGVLNGNWFGSSNGGWTCLKTRETLIDKFDDAPDAGLDRFKSNTKADKRYMFFDVMSYNTAGVDDATWPFDPTTGEILYKVDERRDRASKLADWDAGFLSYKFSNLGWDGERANLTDFPNTDFPLFRLADIYLMYAECAVRGYGDKARAVSLVNELRDRAYQNTSGRVSSSDLTEEFILDERARELYWEGHRRSDLIRFGKFTQNYSWPYKGGTEEGNANVSSKYNLYPISDKDLTSNPNLVQNPGYKSIR